jgi:hypothetical protein
MNLSETVAIAPLVTSFAPGLWYCRECRVVQLISAANHHDAVLYDEGQDELADEEVAFCRDHRFHDVRPLTKKTDRCVSDRPLWDPFRTAYEEVSDGRETFLLKSWREDLNAQRQYTLLRGSLALATTVQLAEKPLRQEIVHAFACSEQTAAAIVNRLQRLVATIPASELSSVYCSADDPSLLLATPDERLLPLLSQSCREAGESLDATQVRDFFVQQQDDALTLELRQSYDVLLL